MAGRVGLDKGVHLKCAHTEGRGAVCYSPDGRCAAAPAAARRQPAGLASPPRRPANLPPAAAHRHILTCGEDTFVKIFEAENLSAEPRTLEHHDAPVTALAIDRKARRR